jgi:hypothetical protein
VGGLIFMGVVGIIALLVIALLIIVIFNYWRLNTDLKQWIISTDPNKLNELLDSGLAYWVKTNDVKEYLKENGICDAKIDALISKLSMIQRASAFLGILAFLCIAILMLLDFVFELL